MLLLHVKKMDFLNAMDNRDRFHEIGDKLYAATKDYLARHTQYPTDVVMAVCWDTLDVKMDSPDKIDASYTQYSMADFIKINEQGLYEPIVY